MINPAPIFTQLVGNAFFGKMVYGLASKIAGRFNYAVRQTLKHHALVEMASKEGVELAGPLTAESRKIAYKNARNQYREIVSNYRRFQRDARSFANQMSPLNPRASRALGRIFSGGQNTRLGTVIGEHIKNEIATMPIMYGMYRYEKSRYPEMRDTNFGKYYAEYLPSSLAYTVGTGAFKYMGRQVNRNLRARVIESGHGQKIVAGSLRAMNAVSRKLGESVYYASKMKQEVFKDRHWRDFMSMKGIRSRLKGVEAAHRSARSNMRSAFSEDHRMFGTAMSDVAARTHAGTAGAFGPHLEDKYRDLMAHDAGPMKWLNSLLPQSQRAFGMGVRNAHLDYAFRRSEANMAEYQTQLLPRDRGLVELGHGGQVYDIRAFHLGKMRDAAASFLENLSFKIPGYKEPLHPFQIMTGGANFIRSQMSRSMRMYKIGGVGATVQGSQFVMKHLIQEKFRNPDGLTPAELQDANETALGQLLGHPAVDDKGKTLKQHGADFLHSLYSAHKTTRGPGGEMPLISKDYGMDPRFLKQTFRNLQQGIIPIHEGSVFFVGKDGYGHLLTGQNSQPYKLAGAGEVTFATEMNKSSMADITARMTGSYKAIDEEGRTYRVGRDHSRPLTRAEQIQRGTANGLSIDESYSYADHLREKWELGGGGVTSIFRMMSGYWEKFKNPRFIKNWFTKEGKDQLFSLKQAKDPQSHKGVVTVFNESLNNADKEIFDMVTQSGKHYKSFIDAFDESTLKLSGHSYGSLSLKGATGIEDVLHRLNKAEDIALHNKSNSMMGIISTLRDKIKTQNPGDVHALLNKPGKSYYSTLGDDYEATLFHNFVSRAAKSTGGVDAGVVSGIQVAENTLEKLGFLKPAEMSAYGKIMRAQSDLHKVRAMSSPAGKEDYTGYMNTVDSMLTNLIYNVSPAEQDVIEKTLSGGNTWFTSMGISKHRYGSFNTDTIFAVGKRGGYTSKTRYRYTEDAQYDSEIHNYTGMGHHFMFAGLNTFNKAMGLLGLGVEKYSSASELATKWITKRILPIGGLIAGVTAADKIIDNSTLFENTPLKEGLFMVPMNAYAGMRLGAQGILDTTGVTGVAKYMEDLFPGSINSAGSGLLRGIAPIVIGATKGFAAGGARGGLKGGVIGGAVGMLLGGGPLGLFGDWDISKDRAELVAQYKGEKEVEIRSGRFWELGSGNYWGEKTAYFRPHMYALARSDYKTSPNYKTDMMTELMSYVDPSVYNRKHYWSRPSLEAPGIFSNIPIVGPFVNLGNEEMHTDDVESLEATNEAHLAMRSSIFGDSTPTERMARATGMGASDFQDNAFYADPREGDSLPSRLSHGFYNLKEVMGLRGFMTETAQETFTGNTQLFSQQPEIEAPNIGSLGRSFWDMNLGGLGGLSEGIRRIFPRQPKEYELYNPVRNLMPGWMPGRSYFLDLKHGDPYSKIEIGEARLPGESYEALRNITPQTPGEADILGTSADEAVAFYAGDIQTLIPRYQWADRVDQKREEIIQTIKASGKLIKEKSMVYDVNKNISASIDATYENDNGDFVPVKFVPYLSKRGSFLSGSTSSLNAYLVLAGQKKGLLVGVDEKGNTTEALVYSDEQRYVNDANKDLEYRKKGYAEMMRRRNAGEPVAPGMYYSMTDRLQILGDVAPYSDEYRNTLKIVRAQIKAGQLDEQQMQEYQDTLDQVDKQKKSLNFMETRFLDRGSPLTLDEAREQNRIDNKYSSVEKGLGAAWEYISTMRNPITRKLLGNRTAMQAYKEDIVYGQSFKSWQRPLDSYVSPYMNLMAQETDPLQGGISGGGGGFILGGPIGGALGAAAGSIWAATGGQIVNNSGWIPDKTRKQRAIMQGADAAEYERYRQLSEATGYNEYTFRMRNTQTGALELNQPMTPGRIASVANKTERAYLYDALSELNSSNVDEYRRLMPKEVVTMTDRGMGLKRDFLPEAMASNYVVDPKDVSNYDLPIEDITVKTMRNEGLEATDVGLGWQDTKRRMAMMEDMGMKIPEMQTRDLPERKTTARINVWQVKDFLRKILADSRPYITVEQSDGPLQILIEIV
jgi:hypothetical protein